ncbi:hypothetical protein GGI11_006264, partial [Coemansia sp. RSA 2049]
RGYECARVAVDEQGVPQARPEVQKARQEPVCGASVDVVKDAVPGSGTHCEV